MKMSYKIALIAAVALFAIAIILFTGPANSDEPTTDEATVAEQTQPEPQPRKTLMNDPGKNSTPPPLAEKSPAPQPGSGASNNSLASDVRDRIRAAAAAQDATQDGADQAAAASPTADAPVNATALTNTGSPATISQPQTKPAAPISRNTLDAILGASANSPAPPASAPATTPTSTTTAAAPDTKPATATDTMYSVQPGDTFSSIASKHYKDESKWFDIAQSNPTVDPTRLRVGQELRLPAIQFLAKHDEPIPAGPTGVKTYTIRPGDSLSTVAEVSYGDPTLWRVIYNFNRDKIGDNPNAIQAGMTLRVPPRVQGAN